MQASSWLALFKQMPQSQHDNLSLVTNIGTEVALQQIIRLERDFMVVRGRMTGTMDTGVIIVIPYDQISYMNFVKRMLVEEANELFKGFKAPALATPVVASAPAGNGRSAPVDDFRAVEFTAAQEKSERAEDSEGHLEEAADSPKKAKAKPVSKDMMLARLRARLSGDQGRGTPPG
jgi:hypothetical protein